MKQSLNLALPPYRPYLRHIAPPVRGNTLVLLDAEQPFLAGNDQAQA
jgi:hypothetical protein